MVLRIGSIREGIADQIEDRCRQISGQDADDKWDQLQHLLAIGRDKHRDPQSDQAADQADQRGAGRTAAVEIAHRVACQGQTNDRDRRANDDRRHQLIDPRHAPDLDDDGKQDIDDARHSRAENQPSVARLHGDSTGKGRKHRPDKGKRRAQEHWAAALGKKQIDDRANTRAEQRRGSRHLRAAGVVDNSGHGDRRRHDRQQLLNGEQDDLSKPGLIFNIVDQVHFSLLIFYFSSLSAPARMAGMTKAAAATMRQLLKSLNYSAFFATSTRAAKAGASLMAISERVFRFISTPAFFRPFMKRE